MKIRFKIAIKTEAHLGVCCFGNYKQQIWEFDVGEELEVDEIRWGEIVKTKTRPGLKGGRFRHCDFILNKKDNPEVDDGSSHDIILNIPESAFDVIDNN